MARFRRPPEWGVEPVPESLRILRTFDLFVLWSSLGVGLLVLAAGTLLVVGVGLGLTVWESAAVAVVGSVIGSCMLAAAAHHGSRAGVPTMVSLRPILGKRGSYVPTVLNVFQLLGWAAFELLVMGIAAATLLGDVFGPWTAALFVPIFGAIVAGLAIGGPLAVVRGWLERFAIWLVYASTAAIAIALLLRGPDPGIRFQPALFSGTTSLLLGLDLVIAMPVSWWPLVSDYNRFERSGRDSVLGTTAGYTIANTVFYVLGAGLVALGLSQGETNFLAVIGLLGLGAFPLLIILVDETDNAFANVYSTAVSIQNLTPRRRQLAFILAATGIAMAGAGLLWARGEGIGGSYEGFLLLVGGLFVPLLGVVIADSFIVRRNHYSKGDFFEAAPRWRWPAFASWIPGAALYFVIVLFGLPIGATLPSFALAAGLHVTLSRVEHSLARRSPATAGDP
ncbi:MAG TPA: cytosine permease [Thermoplasmata archaeon]|nr:cytosine permease [Thermoplasmata archaeon]